jgi:hypothetical protein
MCDCKEGYGILLGRCSYTRYSRQSVPGYAAYYKGGFLKQPGCLPRCMDDQDPVTVMVEGVCMSCVGTSVGTKGLPCCTYWPAGTSNQ